MIQRGDDLVAFVRGVNEDSLGAADAAPRITAFRSARGLRATIKKRFGTNGRVYAAPGWAKAIQVKRRGPGWFQVVDRARYAKGRSQPLSLGWVFDTAPTIRGKKGWTSVPIKGAAPIAASGRRYMWPSEAAQAGYELEIAPVMGKRYKLIFGRRGPRDAWVAMWYWIPPYRAKKALDLDGHHRLYANQIDEVWGEELDKRTAKRARRST